MHMYEANKLFRLVIKIFLLSILASCSSTPEQAESPIEAAPVKKSSTPNVTSEAPKLLPKQETPPQETPQEQTRDIPREDETFRELQEAPAQPDKERSASIQLCEEIGAKLGSVSVDDCLQQNLIHSNLSVEGRSLAYRDFSPLKDKPPLGRVLVIGGIHGDEFSSVSILFKWMRILNKHHSGLFHWRFIPAMNPDGLLRKKSQRQNHNGVDLNRNFPTKDWATHAIAHWRNKTHSNPRRHPGLTAASEPETKWLVNQIDAFNPDVIISMHAPYHLVDYDGPPTAPDKLGGLYLRDLGVFPGSLGNYAGIDLDVPIVTVELKSAGIMPSKKEIDTMWSDLILWLRDQLSHQTSDVDAGSGVSELIFGQ